MRKLIVSNLLTVDGFFEGADHDLSWHQVDAEFDDLAIRQFEDVDTILFGRVTYELMASYWPTSEAVKNEPEVADRMNRLHKVVFSRTLQSVDWQNSRLATRELADEVTALKQAPGKDLIIFGSGSLVNALTNLDLVDVFRLGINPVILGRGTPMFGGVTSRRQLKLLNAQTLRSGSLLLTYAPEKNGHAST